MRSMEDRVPVMGFSTTTQSSTVQAATTRFPRSTLVCTHCGKTGHETSNCFQVIGFPEWWNDKGKSSGGRGSRGRGFNNQGRGRGGRGSGVLAKNIQIGEGVTSDDLKGTGIQHFTPDQWAYLASFLNTQQQNNPDKLSGKRDKLLLYGQYSRYDIIIDSGASHHMTGDTSLLINLQDIEPCPITLPNGQLTWNTKHGSLNILEKRLVLHHVFYAPNLSITLISVAQLLRDVAGFVLFTKQFCIIQDQVSKTLIDAGEEHNGVYHYTGAVGIQASYAVDYKLESYGIDDWVIFRLEFFMFYFILGGFSNNSKDFEKSCQICVRAKHTRDSFSTSLNKAVGCFSMLHCDLWGQYKMPSSCGARYFLTIVDDCSRAVWTILLLEKEKLQMR
ncbi:Retrovirus-related Pol polyprotein from transposon RE1 [Cardamine amara subsp. amara]|uniref:Retrovirus-related Pol polyprotein from transposon RE1 n=1 Tax=Cardamine amara subsp. amara TaxID=228776 RepID=A0ABD1AFF3_CARAN